MTTTMMSKTAPRTTGVAGRMRTFLVLGFVAAVAGLSGCIIDSDSSPRPSTCEANQYVVLDWRIVQDMTNAEVNCLQANATHVLLELNGTPYEFDCALHTGRTTLVPAGTYPSVLRLMRNTQVLSEVAPAIVVPTCGAADLGLVTFGVD